MERQDTHKAKQKYERIPDEDYVPSVYTRFQRVKGLRSPQGNFWVENQTDNLIRNIEEGC